MTPGSPPAKIAAVGDAAPGGGTFSAFPSPSPAGFNARGEVVFFASVSGGSGVGLFLGKVGAALQAIAVNGTAAPAGGNYAFTSSSRDARINALGDVLFQAALSGGSPIRGCSCAASRRRREAVAVQGQTAPGTSAPFATFAGTINNYPGEVTALGPNGEAWVDGLVNLGDHYTMGLFRYRVDGVVKKVLRAGPDARRTGGTLVTISQGWVPDASACSACGRWLSGGPWLTPCS